MGLSVCLQDDSREGADPTASKNNVIIVILRALALVDYVQSTIDKLRIGNDDANGQAESHTSGHFDTPELRLVVTCCFITLSDLSGPVNINESVR